MKSFRSILLGVAVFAWFPFLNAQSTVETTSIQTDTAFQTYLPAMNPNCGMPPIGWAFKGLTVNGAELNLQSVTDVQTILEAMQSQPPTAAAALPKNRIGQVMSTGYWSLQNPYWPPLPGNILGLDVWPLGNGNFILDDRNVDYAALDAAAKLSLAKTTTATPMMRMSMMSSLSTAYAYDNPVYLTRPTTSFTNDGSVTASFSIGGGTNFIPYDILMSTNLTIPVSQWNWLGIGYTSNNYTFYEQPTDHAFYELAKPSKTMIVLWGDDFYGQCDIWNGITNAVQVTGGIEFSVALLNDGTLTGWGYNGATVSELVPTNLTGVAMIASGWQHNVALLTNGTVTAWGDDFWGEINVPAGLSNVIVISAQALHSLALETNGTVVAWGYNPSGEASVPTGLTNVTAISAGGEHNLVVSNGYVVAWGYDEYGQCDVPLGLSNVLDVAAGWQHSMALKKDGTVICWGDNVSGECNVPVGLSDVVAIAAGGDPDLETGYSLALKKDGTLVAWGDNGIVSPLGGMNHVIAIGGGSAHGMAVRTGPPTPVATLEPVDHYQAVGGNVTFNVKGQGLYGVTYQWQTNDVNLAGATNPSLTLTNAQLAQQGSYRAIITDNAGNGSIASSNANFYSVTSPVIIMQSPMPTNQVAAYQTNLILSVVASAPGQSNGFPLHYQWQFNEADISGANASSYVFQVDMPLLGAYSVIVTNAAGSVTSLVWQVTITYAGTYIAPGTLAYHLSTNLVSHTNGFYGIYGAELPLSGWTYAQYNSSNMGLLTNAVWSTNFWLKGVQGLSATPIGISNNIGAQTLITMVSPRHYLRAHHVGTPSGMIAFLDTNNVIYWRTYVQQVQIDTSDTDVGILNAEVPPSVGFLPMIPTNFSNYLPTNSSSYVQGIGMDQIPLIFSQSMTLGNPSIAWSSSATAPFGLTTNWNVMISGGDSSDPEMFLINNQLVLVTHNFHVPDGPNYAYQSDAINAKMHYLSTNNAVGSDYQLAPFSMTNWPSIH